MNAILNFFDSLGSVIQNIIDFVIDFVTQLIGVVKMLADAALTIPKIFGIFPPVLTTSLAAVLAIAIAYKLLGRE